jgi:hypothetical protein
MEGGGRGVEGLWVVTHILIKATGHWVTRPIRAHLLLLPIIKKKKPVKDIPMANNAN